MDSQLTYIKKSDFHKFLEEGQEQILAIIDAKVKSHLPEWLVKSKRVFWIKDPEAQKNLDTFSEALDFFLNLQVSRSSTLIAIGGGATTDLAGFVAASLLRGIAWVSAPTTLLAMVDGAIGGKVAINMSQGKNLVGAFHAPEKVLICDEFLTTLPQEEWLSGKGEILKYGFLSSQINQMILRQEKLESIAFECAQFKKRVVDLDFKEQGERILLNLGHTLGHGFESTLNLPHGLSVIMGIRYLLEMFEDKKMLQEWEKLALALEVPVEQTQLSKYPKFSVDKFKKYISQDKKKIQQKLRLVKIKDVGTCYVEEMGIDEFFKKMDAHAEFKN